EFQAIVAANRVRSSRRCKAVFNSSLSPAGPVRRSTEGSLGRRFQVHTAANRRVFPIAAHTKGGRLTLNPELVSSSPFIIALFCCNFVFLHSSSSAISSSIVFEHV
ncbi:hypothetical protein LINPERHAP1_LOCUS38190, partial [Linum perenne]